jgi:hypothetical protein
VGSSPDPVSPTLATGVWEEFTPSPGAVVGNSMLGPSGLFQKTTTTNIKTAAATKTSRISSNLNFLLLIFHNTIRILTNNKSGSG